MCRTSHSIIKLLILMYLELEEIHELRKFTSFVIKNIDNGEGLGGLEAVFVDP